jgi:Sodium Bile acid symporter family
MATILNALSNLFTLLFVVTSMFSVGLALTIPQMLDPLRNMRVIILALVANFVVVPAVAFLLSRVIPLDTDLRIGLILFGSSAGAPFLPKLAQIAKANVAFAVGLMTLLMVATVIYLPIVLPLQLPGVSVSAGKIALLLILEMLVPLGLGLIVRARYEDSAAGLRQPVTQISNLTLHGGSSPMGSQASSLMSCLFQGCCLAPEGGAPAYWTLTPSRCGVGSSKQPPLVAERTPSKTRYCFYPWERLTTEPANSIQLARCKVSDRTIPAQASGTGNAGRTFG